MAAYGLYTHIQSNKRRSVALLIGLFVLVYVLVFAGALSGRSDQRRRRAARLSGPAPRSTISSWRRLSPPSAPSLWILIAYKFHQSMIDAITGATEVTRAGRAAAL